MQHTKNTKPEAQHSGATWQQGPSSTKAAKKASHHREMWLRSRSSPSTSCSGAHKREEGQEQVISFGASLAPSSCVLSFSPSQSLAHQYPYSWNKMKVANESFRGWPQPLAHTNHIPIPVIQLVTWGLRRVYF